MVVENLGFSIGRQRSQKHLGLGAAMESTLPSTKRGVQTLASTSLSQRFFFTSIQKFALTLLCPGCGH